MLVNEYEGVLCSSQVELPDTNWFDEKELYTIEL